MVYWLPNLTAQEVEEREESDAALPADPAVSDADPSAYFDLADSPATLHSFVSAFGGARPNLRISRSNPPATMTGVLSVYRGADAYARLSACRPSNGAVRPTFAARSREGAVAFWRFSEPAPIPASHAAAKKLARSLASKTFGADMVAPGRVNDADACDAANYLECGGGWTMIGSDVPRELAVGAILDCINGSGLLRSNASIDIETAAGLLERHFPGKWPGAFELGARGPRFWDPDSDPSGRTCVVVEGGVYDFSRGGFRFEDIFGKREIHREAASRDGAVVSDWFSDSGRYYLCERRPDDGVAMRFMPMTPTQARRALVVGYGFSSKSEGGAPSELDRIMHRIDTARRVDAVVSAPGYPLGEVVFPSASGLRYLNRDASRAALPIDRAVTQWGDGFPFIASWLDGMLAPDPDADDYPLQLLVHWVARLYRTAHERRPSKGQALFLIGGAGCGKTLFSSVLLRDLTGSYANATAFLAAGSDSQKNWSGNYLSNLVLGVNDPAMGRHGFHDSIQFGMRIKELVANHAVQANYKGGENIPMDYCGRVVVTANATTSGLAALPYIDGSMTDKVIVLAMRAGAPPPPANCAARVSAEIPAFASYLLHGATDPGLSGDPRFGTPAYTHPDARRLLRDINPLNALREILIQHSESIEGGHLEDSATALFSALHSDHEVGRAFQGVVYSVPQFVRMLEDLATPGDSGVCDDGLFRVDDGAYPVWHYFNPKWRSENYRYHEMAAIREKERQA